MARMTDAWDSVRCTAASAFGAPASYIRTSSSSKGKDATQCKQALFMDGMVRCTADTPVTTYAPYKSSKAFSLTKLYGSNKPSAGSCYNTSSSGRGYMTASPDPPTPTQKLLAEGGRAAKDGLKAVSNLVKTPLIAIRRGVRRWKNPFRKELTPAEAAALAASRSGGTIVSTAGILQAAAAIRADLPPAVPKPLRSPVGRKVHYINKRVGEARKKIAKALQ